MTVPGAPLLPSRAASCSTRRTARVVLVAATLALTGCSPTGAAAPVAGPTSATPTPGTSTAAPREDELEEALDMLADAYADTFDRRPPRLVTDEMEAMLGQGMEPVVIMWALDEAAAAPRPSWAYARAVLAACAREGVRTAEDWRARQDRWANRRRARPSAGPLNYPQREYSEQERRSLYFDLDRE